MVLYYVVGKADICEGYRECLLKHKDRCECHERFHKFCPEIALDPECRVKVFESPKEFLSDYAKVVAYALGVNKIVDLEALKNWAVRVNGLIVRLACDAVPQFLFVVEGVVDRLVKDKRDLDVVDFLKSEGVVVMDKFLNRVDRDRYSMWFRFYKMGASFERAKYMFTVKLEARCESVDRVKLKTYIY